MVCIIGYDVSILELVEILKSQDPIEYSAIQKAILRYRKKNARKCAELNDDAVILEMVEYSEFLEDLLDAVGEEITLNGIKCDVFHCNDSDDLYIGKILRYDDDGFFSPNEIVKYSKVLADLDPSLKPQKLLVHLIPSRH